MAVLRSLTAATTIDQNFTASASAPIKGPMTRLGSRFLLSALAGLSRWARANAAGHVAAAIVVGALAGVSVTAMTMLAEAMHVAFYGIAFDERLSARERISPIAAFLTLGLGGLVIGLFELWRRRRKAKPTVDPIEANALRGGRLSLSDSVVVVAQTLISNGCGASVGLEAGYAQIGSVIGSRVGLALRLRRADQRMLLGCGAAGAIAAAFGAPLTGAFYAFELIIGAYSLANAAPVIAAAVAGALAVKTLGGAPLHRQRAGGGAARPCPAYRARRPRPHFGGDRRRRHARRRRI